MLYIRVDGNSEIGTGHVMRCLAIADAVRKSGGDCTFVTADTHMIPLIEDQGFFAVCLDSTWDDLDKETKKMNALIVEQNIKKLLVDSYFVTPAYLQRLHELTQTIYIDDLNAFRYPCDILINYNVYADSFNYPTQYPDTKLLLGCRYAPLREEFQNLPKRVPREEVQSILITVGGTDAHNIAVKLVKKAKSNPKTSHFDYHIVAGRFNPHNDELNQLKYEHDGVFIHRNVQSMSKLMLDCDIAVSAGGSTLYELCACGTPTVVFALADNQLDATTSFGERYMINAGDIRKNEESCLSKILDGITRMAYDTTFRYDYSRKSQELVDGNGATRIANALRLL